MRLAAFFVGTIFSTFIATAEDPPKPTTIDDPAVPPSELELRLKPLTKAELTVEADGWLGLLKAKVAEISDAEIAAARTKGDEQSAKLEQIAKLRDERVARADRLNLVLKELTAKGGAAADYETYLNAVSGIKMQVADTGAAWRTVVNWLKSESGGIRYGKNILLFLATLVVFKILASIVGGVTSRAMGSFHHISQLLRDFTINATRKVIMFVGFVVALSMLEVNIGPFLAAMGAVGFVVGFALQGTLSNFASGVMILLYRPYDLQDEVNVAGQAGKVTSMTLVSTVLHDKDGHIVTIPNSAVWGGTIVNLSTAAPAPAPVKSA